MNQLPKISIVIPTYNQVEYLKITLNSIFSQKYENLEVIIQDGGSKDATVSLIKKYEKKYPNEVIWESKKDKGQVDAINKGMKKAKGDILTYINSDDLYEKDTLNYVGNFFKSNPTTQWLVGKGRIIDDQENEIFKLVSFYKNLLLLINKYSLLLAVNYIYQPSVFFSRDLYEKLKPFIGVNGIVMEYEMWLKMGRQKMPNVTGKYFSKFRLTKDSFSSTQHKKILAKDMDVVCRYTRNPLILLIHSANNIGRVILAKVNK